MKTKSEYPRVRLATPEDLPQVLDMGRALHAENGMTSLNEDMIEAVAQSGVAGDGAIIGVIGAPGQLEGMIQLAITRYYYSSELHLEEMYSYVRPEFRRSKNARSLLMFAKSCSDRLNVPLLIGIVSNKDTKRKIALYERVLGEPAGAYFLYNARTGVAEAAPQIVEAGNGRQH
jgi:hypothetical protein